MKISPKIPTVPSWTVLIEGSGLPMQAVFIGRRPTHVEVADAMAPVTLLCPGEFFCEHESVRQAALAGKYTIQPGTVFDLTSVPLFPQEVISD